jgi:hypothetical protein
VTAGLTGLPMGVLFGHNLGSNVREDLLLYGGVALATAIAILAAYGPLARLFAVPRRSSYAAGASAPDRCSPDTALP